MELLSVKQGDSMENFFPSVPIVTYCKNSKIKHSKRVNFSTGIVHTAAAHDVK